MLKEISIEIIRKCPNNCLHCSSYSDIHCTEIIEFETFANVIDRGKILGLQTVCLSGGEPFLHNDLERMIDFAISKDVKVVIYTSGISLDQNSGFCSVDKLLLERISKKVEKLIFNFEAATEKTYNLIMGTTGCFELFKESVLNANKYGILTEAHFVPMKANIGEIESLIEIGIELGIKKFSFLRLVSHGRAELNKEVLDLGEAESQDMKNMLMRVKERYRDLIRIGVPLSKETEHKCEAAKGKLNIRYDGEVFPCEVFKNKTFMNSNYEKLRNIKTNDIDKLYVESPFLNDIRSGVSQFEQSDGCEKCYGQHLINLINIK